MPPKALLLLQGLLLSPSSAPLNPSSLPQAQAEPGSPSPHSPLFKALLAWG